MDFIFEIPNSLSEDLCKEMIVRFENDSRKLPGIAGNPGAVMPVKKSLDLCFSSMSDWSDIDKILQRELLHGVRLYQEHLRKIGCTHNFGSKTRDTGYQIQKTVEGEYYGWHNDSSLPNDRFLTFIWYLTSHDPIKDGGGTAFHPTCANGKIITPETGKLLIFPATWTYVHMGLPLITNRPKYICTGWVSSPDM